MTQKNYKVLCRLKCLLLVMIIILNSSISVNAYEALKGDVTYTCYNKDNGVKGFFYVIEGDGSKEIVYCYNHDLNQPSSNGTSGYKKYDYFSTEINTVNSEVKSEIAAILYAGYPNNALGFMEEFGVSEDEAREYTQDAIWSLTNGNDHTNSNISRNSYLHALYFYAEKEEGKYGDTGSVSISDDVVLTQVNGVWKSNILTIAGDYTGAITFNDLPENITIYDARTNNVINSSVNVGDSIYIVYSGEVEGNFSEILTYNYETTDVRFYKSADNTYQDMIGSKITSNEGKISISAENENKELPSKNTNAKVVINKVEEGTENRLVGAELSLYEGNPNNGKLIEQWTTTRESKEIKVEAGKTYTLVEKSAPEGYEIADPITFTVDSSIVNSDNINIIEDTTDYVGYRYNSERYITDGQTIGIVYCINHDLDNPDVVLNPTPPSLADSNYPHYRHWMLSSVNDEILRENQTVDFTREQLAEVLLAGYPTDYYGYQKKYNLSNSQAYSRTQAVLDAVLSGDTSLKSTSGLSGEYLALTNYYNDLVKAYLAPKAENADSVVDFFRWVNGTGKYGKTYQNLVGITPFENNITIEVTMEDAKKDIVVVPNISVSVEKVWEDGNSVGSIPNEVEVQLYRDGKAYGNVVKLSNDNDWKYQWNDLDGAYEWTVDEVNVPEGYIKTITNNDTSFIITNTKIVGKLEITKTDIADGALLPNAGFRIYDENKNVIAEGRTNDQGIATFELGYGKYYYQEFDAPEGYVIDETLFPFEIKTNGEIVKAQMTNTKIVGKLEITKTDIADGTLLPNAGFRIYDENKNVIAEGRTNDQGIAIFELGYGKYYYQEFDAPEGYVIDETLFPFEIKTNGEIVKAQMTNMKIESDGEETEDPDTPINPSTPEESEDSVEIEEANDSNGVADNAENNTLPQTGGNNSIIYLLLGGVLSLAGFGLFSIGYKSKR